MVSTSGHKLMTDDTIETIRQELMPRTTLITPNLHEARILTGHELNTVEDMEKHAEVLSQTLRCSALIKGGHLEGGEMCDILYDATEARCFRYTAPKIESQNLHGTGCTLSSSIATKLSQGHSMKEAIALAKDYVTKAIDAAKDMHIGHGHGPLWHF